MKVLVSPNELGLGGSPLDAIERGVSTRRIFGIHDQRAFDLPAVPLRHTEAAMHETNLLPKSVGLAVDEQNDVVSALKAIL